MLHTKTKRYVNTLPRSIKRAYQSRRFSGERLRNRLRELLFGTDLTIFDPTIAFFKETRHIELDRDTAYMRALDKARHKRTWFTQARTTETAVREFYQQADVYPFRQPYNWRLGGNEWYGRLVNHIERPAVLEYGCGSACLTEYLMSRMPSATFTVADIPSVTLDFVRWKRERYGLTYNILEIGEGALGIPLTCGQFDLIVCRDVLEHTMNPVEITQRFIEAVRPGGVLVIDFLDAAGGENLSTAAAQRPHVKMMLAANLIPVKSIDEDGTNDGVYVKPLSERRC